MSLKGKTALVTGSTSGIGLGVARALAGEGADILMNGFGDPGAIEALRAGLAAEFGVKVAFSGADISQPAQVAAMVAQAGAALGGVDILVNNAGVGKYGPLSTLTAADYDWMMNTNMRSSFLCTQAFLPGMLARREGWIVFVGSVAGLKGLPNEAVYCASKFAQMGFAQALDYETREQGVKVSVVAPGGVHTHFAFGTGRTPGDPMLDGMMDAEDIAQAVLFAVTQPPKARVFLIGMRPMSEPL